jgi:hypothetical protein
MSSPEWAKLNPKPVGQEFSDEPLDSDIPF